MYVYDHTDSEYHPAVESIFQATCTLWHNTSVIDELAEQVKCHPIYVQWGTGVTCSGKPIAEHVQECGHPVNKFYPALNSTIPFICKNGCRIGWTMFWSCTALFNISSTNTKDE